MSPHQLLLDHIRLITTATGAEFRDSSWVSILGYVNELSHVFSPPGGQLNEPACIIQHNERVHILGINYHLSTIVLDDFTSHPANVDTYGLIHMTDIRLVASDRAPDATSFLAYVGGPNCAAILLPEPHRLFATFRPCHHTILLSAVAVAWAKVVTRSIDLDLAIVRKVVVIPRSTPNSNECDSDPDIGLRDDEGHACLWRMPCRQGGI
ncbi:hypothetical protein BDN67DRAFT_1014602 [Paxillus ammoniavirescens]|nr:hypothetical protein BDN67DRAFT_1014602 [Paxillus ammoniavirescens]